MGCTLGEVVDLTAGRLVGGDEHQLVERVATLGKAGAGSIAFLANPKYRRQLRETRATAVILSAEHLAYCPVAALVCDNPYLAFARVAAFLNPARPVLAGRHPTAVVHADAVVDASAWVGPYCVLAEGVWIGPRVYLGAGCILEPQCRVGADTRLVARVTLCAGTEIGERAIIHPGAVIGSDGFGLAKDAHGWVKVPQLGRVKIGNDVEIGANTTIDRGAIEDTQIHDGVKLDNQIQVAHNVIIGEHTAIAACVGISGSTRIGRHCLIGGGVGFAGHLDIGDNVSFSGQSLVTRSFTEPGYYSGGLPAVSNQEWKRCIARMRHLDDMARRLRALEDALRGDDLGPQPHDLEPENE